MTKDRMGAKRYLEQIRRLDSRINVLIAQRDDLMIKRTAIRGIRYDEERVQTSPSGEVPSNRVTEKIIDMSRQIDERVDEYVDIRAKITDQIAELSDKRYEAILRMRYIDRLPFYEIADALGYQYETVRHYHLDALRVFAEVYAYDIEVFRRNSRKNTQEYTK